MSNWRDWSLTSWNERLLAHFFSYNEQSSPVIVLLVTAEELAHATGDVDANPTDVRKAFIQSVRSGVLRSKSLLENASDYSNWPFPPPKSEIPRFVAHLLFTCVAASESSSTLRDEGSFISRLRKLTGDQLPDHSLNILPKLWENLEKWLKVNEEQFRTLVLPEPGGLARIGYTIGLTFPDRRDQKQLSELLDVAELSGQELQMGKMLSLIATERSRFRPCFMQAFDDFQEKFKTSIGRSASLSNHRFWAAVREASLRGRGNSRVLKKSVRTSMLGDENDEFLSVFIVSEDISEIGTISFVELPCNFNNWRFAVVPKEDPTLNSEQLKQIVIDVLRDSIRLPKLSRYIDQGLIPFIVESHGLLEVAKQDQLGEISVALVRNDMVETLMRLINNDTVGVRPSIYQGWAQVHNPCLRVFQQSELEDTTLSRMWFLQESNIEKSIRIVGGIRADNGWLGLLEVHPYIVGSGGSKLVLRKNSENIAILEKLDNGRWKLPPSDLTGQYTIVDEVQGSNHRLGILFHNMPFSEAFKSAKEPDAWIVEEVSGTGILSRSLPFTKNIQTNDCGKFCDRVAFLGRDTGIFVEDANIAAWKVTQFANSFFVEQGKIRGSDALPSFWATCAGSRRRWRKLLFKSKPKWSNPNCYDARQLVRQPSIYARFPRKETHNGVPNFASIQLPSPSKSTDRLVWIIASRASTLSGIGWRDWFELAKRVLGIEGALLHHVLRGWLENGLIDVASHARWRKRAIFARLPRLIAFCNGDYFGAVLSGLTLPTTMDNIYQTARSNGMLIEERLSVSPFVPKSLSFQAPDRKALETLASTCRLELQWVDLSCLERLDSSLHNGRDAPPLNYENSTSIDRWSLNVHEHSMVTVKRFWRRDRPDYWTVSRDNHQVWFYEFNLARIWGSTMLKEPAVTRVENQFLLNANHAFLPLPIARMLSIFGAGFSGPAGSAYLYPIGNQKLIDYTTELMSQSFTLSRLEASVSAEEIG
jgi:hypothetical protein